ncbi:MAG: large-conductance mechanosensitive channel protein MscL [Pirellulales bacterium]|nr:large-conductance mechanosensitive channel protein MscL [Pirellulales bacterium]
MSILKEFRDFAIKGNVVDMAVGVIIGAAFGKIVSSLVADVVMPPIGLLLGNVDFSNLVVTLRDAKGDVPAVAIRYGAFINTVLDFAIVAAAIFFVVRQMNRLKKPPTATTPATRDCPRCLMSVPAKATRCGHCTSELNAT